MESCLASSKNLNFNFNIIIHILLLFIFLSAFFILFVSKISKNSFEYELNKIINEIGNNIDKLDDTQKQSLSNILKIMPINNLIEKTNKPSSFVEEHNNWIKRVAIVTSILGVIGVIIIIYIYKYNCGICIPIQHILFENIIAFAFIGVVEYLFFTRIALKFIPAPPSLLVSSFIDKIKN
jgi:preprotein translocase subunit Sss1